MHDAAAFPERRPFNGVQAALESLGKDLLLDAAEVCRGLGLSVPPAKNLQCVQVRLSKDGVVLPLGEGLQLELRDIHLNNLDQGTLKEVARTCTERVCADLHKDYTNDTPGPVTINASKMHNNTRTQVKSSSLQVCTTQHATANLGVSLQLPNGGAAGPNITLGLSLRNMQTVGEQTQSMESDVSTQAMAFVVQPGHSVTMDRMEVTTRVQYWFEGNMQLDGKVVLCSTRHLQLGRFWKNTRQLYVKDSSPEDKQAPGCLGAFCCAAPTTFTYTFGSKWEGKQAFERLRSEFSQGSHDSCIRWDAAVQFHRAKADAGSSASQEFLAALDRLQRPHNWRCIISGSIEVERNHTHDRVRATPKAKGAAATAAATAAAAAAEPQVAPQVAAACTAAPAAAGNPMFQLDHMTGVTPASLPTGLMVGQLQ